MRAKLSSWWKNTSKTLRVVIIISFVILIAFLVVNILGYIFLWDWTGLVPHVGPSHSQNTDFQPGKTLWDWYQLLIIPVVLVVGGFLLNFAMSRTERGIALDKQREDALQAYIDSMSALLLEKDLRKSNENDEVRNIARVRTLTVLRRLDGERKRNVLQFLHESGLIEIGKKVIDLFGADLRKAELDFARLENTDLSHTDLSESNLIGTDLSEANLRAAILRGTYLSFANLSKAILLGADLREADLTGATGITTEQLNKAYSLEGATMPDGSIHD